MDKEQVNELKPGDEVLIRSRFEKIKENGDFNVSYLLTTVHGKPYIYQAAVHPNDVIIKSPPKHDPCRLFKKGDKVRVVEYKGRLTGYDKKIYKVCEDEEESGRHIKLSLDSCIGHVTVDAAYLELISPVDEMEPYEVECDDDEKEYSVTCRDKFVCTYPYDSDSFYTKEQAKAAAETECARLNEEWRKEQQK